MPYNASATDIVIAQTPQPGAANVDRPNVSLLLNTPAPLSTPAFVMPDLSGMPIASVTSLFVHLNMKLEPVQFRNVGVPAIPAIDASGVPQAPKPPTPAGVVLAQKPDAGMHVDASTPIELTVSE
jgi:beta-lactam-binding protein with PASTA domain